MDRKDTAILILVAILIGPLVLTGYTISQQSPGIGGGGGAGGIPDWVNEQGGGVEACSYLIYREGSITYAKNQQPGTNRGRNQFSDSSANSVFVNVLAQLTRGTICVKASSSEYQVTSSLTWASNVNLKCEGFGTQITIDAGAIDLISIPDGATNIFIQDCYMRNFNIAVGSGIITTVGSVTALNVIHNFLVGSNGAIEAQSCSDCIIDGNAIQATRTAISLRSLFRTIISNNIVQNTNDNCIDIGTVQDVTVTGNICRDTQGTPTTINGVYVDTVQGALSITGNEIRNILRNGIQLNTITGPMTAVSISGNTIVLPGQVAGGDAGIYLFGDTTRRVYNVTIAGNFISHPGRQGILIEFSTNIVVSGNILNNAGTISSANGYGIRLDESTEVVITSNRASDNSQYGIGIFSSSSQILVTGNDVRGNTVGGMSITGGLTGILVRDNLGFITENMGATSVADGGTISHGLVSTPTTVQCTTSITDEFCSVTALAATTFTVTITKHDGTAGTTQIIYWYAVFIP